MVSTPELAVVAPFYNEQGSLPAFLEALSDILTRLDIDFEVILVDDGSTDAWRQDLRVSPSLHCRVVELVSNSGHQAALDAGLQETTADFVITMDSDLQHPPEVIAEMLAVAKKSGCDVVYAQREGRREDSFFKRWTGEAYYRSMKWLSGLPVEANAADYRLMSRFVVDILNNMPDRKVFRLLIPALNFRAETVTYRANPRYAGKSKYGLWRMLSLAKRSVIQFSLKPLRLVASLGVIVSAIAFFWVIYAGIQWLTGATVAGWTSLMAVTLLLGGAILFSLGVIGEYLGEVYETVKGRPSYIIQQVRKL